MIPTVPQQAIGTTWEFILVGSMIYRAMPELEGVLYEITADRPCFVFSLNPNTHRTAIYKVHAGSSQWRCDNPRGYFWLKNADTNTVTTVKIKRLQ